jgi:hypothetical protein
MFFSTRSKAQENNAQPINISGTVITVDTLGLKKKKAVDAIDTSVVFMSDDGDKYYVLCDKNKLAVFNRLIKRANKSVKISGTQEEINRDYYIVVENFIFL